MELSVEAAPHPSNRACPQGPGSAGKRVTLMPLKRNGFSSAAIPSMNCERTPAVLVIEPVRGFGLARLREIWAYRELLYFLVWRDVKVRYRQTALGAAWAILQPLAMALVFTLFFARMAGIESDGVPYTLFAYAGLLPWTFFAQGTTQSASSLVESANLITRVYFPRLVIPLSAALGKLIDFLVALPFLAVLMVHYRRWPGPQLFCFPLFLLLALVACAGVGTCLGALNVRYRDVRHVVPFLVQLWLFATPVIYPTSTIASFLHSKGLPIWLLGLNPMTGVVEGFRWSLLGTATQSASLFPVSVATSVALLFVGMTYFQRVERSFADVV
jgi:lipopolysaccharide transport system permease protein